MKHSQKTYTSAIFLFFLLTTLTIAYSSDEEAITLDPMIIPRYVNQITSAPPAFVPEYVDPVTGAQYYTVDITEFTQQILPSVDISGSPTGWGTTTVWGYGGITELGYIRNQPGPTFEAERGAPIYVRYQNKLEDGHLFAVDPTLHWANPNNLDMPMMNFENYPPGYADAQGPVPIIPHLHGGEVQSTSDGHPEAWFTSNGLHGEEYNTELTTWWDGTPIQSSETVFYYPNDQPVTTLWYHDHALGITRINVMSGLAGFYLLRDPADTVATNLPNGQYEVPLVFQDRIFLPNGEMFFPSVGNSPEDHPYWGPEFFGNVSMVNGLVWPNMDVDKGQYRLRLLDGSNARFYTISFKVKTQSDQYGAATGYGETVPFTLIGCDGGYLQSSVENLMEYTIAPGERADILIDFSGLESGTEIVLTNKAYTPYKGGINAGDPPLSMDQLMQFTVTNEPGFIPKVLPEPLNPALSGAWPTLGEPDKIRLLPLVEVMSEEDEPVMILLNGQKWNAEITETPTMGTTEDWYIINPTEDTHPIHLHLVQFQIISRQAFESERYFNDWIELNQGMAPPFPQDYTPLELPVDDYLMGNAVATPDEEKGWKDMVKANPGEITIIRTRFTPTNGDPDFSFNVTEGPGYVWHCHILDHEDNEMMRPYVVLSASNPLMDINAEIQSSYENQDATSQSFIVGEKITLELIGSPESASIIAQIKEPDNTQQQIEFPTSINLKKAGNYEINVAITAVGYNDANIMKTISVLPDTPSSWTGSKMNSTLDLIITRSGTNIDDTVTATGSISPIHSDAEVDITFSLGGTIKTTITAVTDDNGEYSINYSPDTIGAWSAIASWSGDANHDNAESTTQTFSVETPTSNNPEINWVTIGGIGTLALIGAYIVLRRQTNT